MERQFYILTNSMIKEIIQTIKFEKHKKQNKLGIAWRERFERSQTIGGHRN